MRRQPGRLGAMMRAAAWVALCLCGAAQAQEFTPGSTGVTAPPRVEAPYSPGARVRPAALDARTLLQLALLQNADVLYARLQARIADEGLLAETGLYDPIFYASLRRDGRSRQRTVEERLTAALGGITRLEELGRSGELGMRLRAPTGGEASVALRSGQRRSNIIGSAPFAQGDAESAGALVLTLRQPLMRGLGRDVTETDLRVADAERDVGRWQFRQQVLRVGSDALSAYWQLERAQTSQALRVQAQANAQALRDDVRVRIGGGRLPPAALDEADAALATREAELARGAQALADAQTRVRQLLDLPPDDQTWGLAPPGSAPALPPLDRPATALASDRLPSALAAWPALRIAQLRRTQADLRLTLAADRNRPALDVQASYSNNSLTYGPIDAASKALQGRNPDWSIGLSLELPFGGDKRASAQQRAQALRREQADLEIHSVRQSLANDLLNRVIQLASLRDEQRQLHQDLEARKGLLQADETQFAVGSAPLNRVLRRQSDLLEAQLRVTDIDARLALAQVALQLVDGSLLSAYDVRIED
jgi:outer membrane protein TolC